MGLIRSKSSSEGEPATRPAPPAPSAGGASDSLIAVGMTLDGDCHTDGPLRVDGHVKGSVHAGRLAVSPAGRVDGDVVSPAPGGTEHVFLIDGRVDGAVRAPHVEVGPDGAVGGGVEATRAVVRGRVVGAITASERLLIEETAVIEGDVTAPRLGLKEGAQVVGAIRIGKP